MKLSGIKIFPRIGVTPEERAVPQECRADVVIDGDWAAAAATDDLERSIDYVLILEKVRATAAAREYVLLETLAHTIAQSLVFDFPLEGCINVCVRKHPPAFRDLLDYVEIEVEKTSVEHRRNS